MSELKIEKNIPIPNEGDHSVYGEMEVGDSVFVKSDKSMFDGHYYYTKKYGFKFTTRYDKKKRGFRIWRVA